MSDNIGTIIMKKRKQLGYTQQKIADCLNVSFQAVSKWENGTAYPDISLLPQLAHILGTTTDTLLGYSAAPVTDYEKRYGNEAYYWGLQPNELCYEIMKIKPPVKPYQVLEIGCGEGKDAVFLAKNGYLVTAFDAAQTGIDKARSLAKRHGVQIDFFQADVLDYRPDTSFDIVFSSGVLHYIPRKLRGEVISSLKEHTTAGGIHAVNVFVDKPFIDPAPDREPIEVERGSWRSGELQGLYHDWLFHAGDEIIFDCDSGGVPHQHCMDILIAEKMDVKPGRV